LFGLNQDVHLMDMFLVRLWQRLWKRLSSFLMYRFGEKGCGLFL